MKSMLPHFFAAAVLTAGLPLARAADRSNADPGQFNAIFVADTGEVDATPADAAAEKASEAEALRRQSEERREQAAGIGGPVLRVSRGPMVNVAFVGVETSPVTPALTAQLALPEGTGLVVEQVVPDSPAAASLKPNDILLKLDDQWLIDPWQFAVLVRQHKGGDEVVLTYMRGGKQATVSIKLAEHQAPQLSELRPERGSRAMMLGIAPGMPGPDPDRMLGLVDQMRRKGEGENFFVGRVPGVGRSKLRAVQVDAANSNFAYSDEDGTLDLTVKDGKKTLVAKDPQGKELFSGPVDTPEQRQAMPEAVRARLEKLEKMRGVSFKTGPDFKIETRKLQPEGEGIVFPLTARPLPAPQSF